MKTPQISVCIPMYNAAQYIGECLDSVLSQTFTDYEVVVIDDGSTDASCAIVETYHDERIRLVRKEHNYIATINSLFEEARGKYVARMDADDVMYPHRLQVQIEFMESHPDVDILGSGMSYLNTSDVVLPPRLNSLGFNDLLESFCIFNPTTFFRLCSVRKARLRYDSNYIYSEDYYLWAKAICKGLKIFNISEPLVKYRITDSQVSCRKSNEQFHNSLKVRAYLMKNWLPKLQQLITMKSVPIDSINELTVVIPFYNEGNELGNTIKSIRDTVGNQVDIIAVDDKSDDGYDYEKDLQPYHVRMVHNRERIGAAASKSHGIALARTPYFILLDAHMRFYSNDWHSKLLCELKKNSNRMLCCQTRFLEKNEDGSISERSSFVYGAFLDFYTPDILPTARWNYLHQETPNVYPLPVPAVLGATYASSKVYWNKIKGFDGLVGYGSEEEYISLKAWLDGGGCYLLYDIEVGHIYRCLERYTTMSCQFSYNRMLIAETLLPYKMRCKVHASIMQQGMQYYFNVKAMMKGASNYVKSLRAYYQQTFLGEDILQVIKFNNATQYNVISDLEDKMKIIPSIIEYLISADYSSNWGLTEGKTSLLLLLCLYKNVYKSSVYDNLIENLSHEMLISNSIKTMPCEFRNGYLGYAWSLMFMTDHEYLSPIKIEDFLRFIDNRLESEQLNVQDWSLDKGVYGIVVYVAARIMYFKRTVSANPFSESFMQKITAVVNKMFKSSDKSIRFFENLFVVKDHELYSGRHYMTCEFTDWASLPKYLPNNSKYWTVGLDGATGYAIRMLSTYIKLKKNESQQIYVCN